MATKKSAPKSMDVMKPGETTPEDSGRPILVTNRPIMQDPMVKETSEEGEDETPKPATTTLAGGSKVIAPLEDAKAEDTSKDSINEELADETLPASTQSPEPEEEKTQAAVVNAVVSGAASGQNSEKQDQVVQDEHQQKIQKLIESKKYVVPIGQVNRRKLHQQLAVLVFLIAVVGGAYVAADLGYIPTPFELPVHVVKQ